MIDVGLSDWKRNDFTISWKDVSVSVKVQNNKFFDKNPQPYKRVINNVSGIVKAGSLVVLMGPSGAGKSTLMAALAHRYSSNDVFVEGDVRINGEPIGDLIRQISGFMHQEDLFISTLTVREHLEFMARLKLDRNKNGNDIKRIVNKLLLEVGLSSCADSRIGSGGEKKVISGGEKKRLSFATEILTDPPIVFCDEPTTGLDSFSAHQLVHLLKAMTSRGKTVLCTIHQPSSTLFSMFHQLILLTEGRIAFMGDINSALKFFKKHGFGCPENYNPAEVFISALSTSLDQRGEMRRKRLCDEFAVSEMAREIEEAIAQMTEEKSDIITKAMIERITNIRKRRQPSWTTKLFWLTSRSFLQVLRDPSVQAVRILQKLGIATMAGLCFNGTIGLSQTGVQSVQGAIFVMVTENTFPPMYSVLSLFPNEFPLFSREYKNDLYTTLLYYISKMISLLPGLIIEPVVFVLAAYLIAGLKPTVYAFFTTAFIATLTNNVAAACGCFFSSAFGSVSMALAFLVPIDYTLMVTSGIFIKLSSIPVIMSWFRYLSWFLYSNEALSIVQWENVYNISCEYQNPEIPCLNNGLDVLEKFDFSPANFVTDITAMIAMYFIFHLLGYIFLWRKIISNA